AASGVKLKFSQEATKLLALTPEATLSGSDLLAAKPISISAPAKDLVSTGMPLPELPSLSASYFDLSTK
ncbi:MAG: hypothetical protein EBZ07_03355, partial [Verrucomicrobia bacterium]|nr:hypothetical protein [Verrucomicrobiota bacterium]